MLSARKSNSAIATVHDPAKWSATKSSIGEMRVVIATTTIITIMMLRKRES